MAGEMKTETALENGEVSISSGLHRREKSVDLTEQVRFIIKEGALCLDVKSAEKRAFF